MSLFILKFFLWLILDSQSSKSLLESLFGSFNILGLMNKAWYIPQYASWGIMQLDKIIPISWGSF